MNAYAEIQAPRLSGNLSRISVMSAPRMGAFQDTHDVYKRGHEVSVALPGEDMFVTVYADGDVENDPQCPGLYNARIYGGEMYGNWFPEADLRAFIGKDWPAFEAAVWDEYVDLHAH